MFIRKYVVLRTVFDKNKGIKTRKERKKERKKEKNKKQRQAQTKRNQQQLNKIIKLIIL